MNLKSDTPGSRLFSGLRIGALELRNRILIAPMCQYSADEGSATDWHLIHLGSLALSGAGLLIIEATAVTPEGRITPGDLGLWNDGNEAALVRVLASIRHYSPVPIAIQLAHAGRKASSHLPWDGGAQIAASAPSGWRAVAPSPLPFAAGQEAPTALDAAGLVRVRDAFVAAARRAASLGLDGIELHGAHGYLLHEFLSPLANQRTDRYGGSLENRMRFPLEVLDAVRAAVPSALPVWMRISATDWVPGGWDIDEAVVFAEALERQGAAAIHVSSGGLSPDQAIRPVPGYQLPLARRIRERVSVPVIGVGLITDPAQAEAALVDGDADAVALARAMLYDPRWPWHAAAALGETVWAPNQYLRSQPAALKHLFDQPGRPA